MKKLFLLLFLITCAVLELVKDRLPPPHPVEGGILFQYDAPSARRVCLAGEFNDWKFGTDEKAIPLKKDEKGIWSVVFPLKPGRYKYKFVIDDVSWVKDPNGEDANDEHGNSLIIVK